MRIMTKNTAVVKQILSIKTQKKDTMKKVSFEQSEEF